MPAALQTLAKTAGVGLLFFWLLLLLLERVSVYHPGRMAAPDPGAYDLHFEEVWLEGRGGARLRAWFIPGGPVAVIYSGGNAETAAMTVASPSWRRMMRELGLSVLVWDYPGYGASEGRPSEAALRAGGRAAAAHLRQRPDVDPDRMIAWGHSLGSFVAADLAAEGLVAGAVLQAPLSSVSEVGRDLLGPLWHLARWLPFVPRERLDVLGRVSGLRVPVLVLHGTRDEVLSVRHGRLVAGASSGTRLVEVAGATHMSPWGPYDDVHWEAYRRPVMDWLAAWRE
jgi:uncharacterized protein